MAIEGVDEAGYIRREGSLSRIQPEFATVVDRLRATLSRIFGPDRLHSAYLYGSVPRGTAIAGTSDLDVLLALRHEPTALDRSNADAIAAELDTAFREIRGVGIEIASIAKLTSELERYDLGWFVACLCTPLLGDDLAADLPRYRPSALLARETNGDLALQLPQWRSQRANASTDLSRIQLSRTVSRRIVRTGLTLVMPRWGGWTSDLIRSAEIFGHYYPGRADHMHTAATIARSPTTAPAALDLLIDDLGPWLATEYIAVHGPKTPRP
ncbi:nucleotidyltransferase domain-containing protein [Nocardia sp. CA2R105]|uniref:nucleotidyltransferase domain-containing protein n=1 Tax=Nocardia coffeae TaxID=2873381 RepID=UPI001CA73A6D|nr:nucleotidyltransferase domain-containing protein [Nocardia coffeae]MBY8855201.1 nucleotidyltransferase domain-containing protein [Nocardia coffeae]